MGYELGLAMTGRHCDDQPASDAGRFGFPYRLRDQHGNMADMMIRNPSAVGVDLCENPWRRVRSFTLDYLEEFRRLGCAQRAPGLRQH